MISEYRNMYVLNEVLKIVENCDTENQLSRVAEVVGEYKKDFVFNDLLIIAGMLKLRFEYVKKGKFKI
jgi:hypothetical protein